MAEHAQLDLLPEALVRTESRPQTILGGELPLTVKEAAIFLGVRQIPHLRVMGRNIRFLRSDLEPFRASFKQEVENG